MSDIPVEDSGNAAAVAADAAADAAAAATAAAIDAATATPQPNPADIIAADTEIARQQEETERTRIEARARVRIAELQNEEPPWLSDIRAFLIRLEDLLTALTAAAPERHQSSTPLPSAGTTVVVQPEAPTVVEQAGAIDEAPAGDGAVVMPESLADQGQNNPPAPARAKPRWI